MAGSIEGSKKEEKVMEEKLTWCYCKSSDEVFNFLIDSGYYFRGRKRGDLYKIFFDGEFGSINEDMLMGTETPFYVKDGAIIMGDLG